MPATSDTFAIELPHHDIVGVGPTSAIPLRRVELEVKNQQTVLKTIRDSSPNYALSTLNTSISSQSRETVHLTAKGQIVQLFYATQ